MVQPHVCMYIFVECFSPILWFYFGDEKPFGLQKWVLKLGGNSLWKKKKKSLGYGEKNATSVELIFFLLVNSSPSFSTYSFWLRIR